VIVTVTDVLIVVLPIAKSWVEEMNARQIGMKKKVDRLIGELQK